MSARQLDWSDCPLVEVDERRLGGRPVIKGTRMAADDVVANHEYGVSAEVIAEQFGLSTALVNELLTYAERLHPVAHPA
ncbi:MAG: DUF433 domain-containing protein [Acidobacteria bacterium]|nr:DUF433 domain-containing protein [Acidobacteriota bacterium]